MKLFFVPVILLLVCISHAQVDRDWSFQQMCEFWGGGDSYKPRDGYNSMYGDKCTMKFPMATDTEEPARTYCEEQVPYHIITAVPGQTTECKAEATLVCESGWVQMFGRCYNMIKELMTRDKAQERCKRERDDAAVAFMHREALPFRIEGYFTYVSRLWIDASEAITQNLIHDVPGGNLLLAIEGYMFNLPNIALARVDKSMTAMVLCEYTPKMTQSESNYLLDRYGEIYFPTVRTSEGSYVRTASSLNRNENDNMADNNYCNKVMRPFVPNGKAQSAYPTREFMDKLYEVNKNEGTLIVRISAFSMNSKKSERMKTTCIERTAADFQMFLTGNNGGSISKTIEKTSWRTQQPEECDAASWSSAVVLSHEAPTGLEAMSDARYAPIYCQSITDTYKYGVCPDGFSLYNRKHLGQQWCHKFVTSKKNYDDAEKDCQTMGAHLSGYTEPAELDFIDGLQTKSGLPFNHGEDTWLGARRRSDCIKTGEKDRPGYEADPTSPCSRVRVFEWVNNVAPNPPAIENDWFAAHEPNYQNQAEVCLTIIKGNTKRWNRTSTEIVSKKLNDIACNPLFYYICGKEAPIVKA